MHLTTGSGASRRRRNDAELVDRQPHHAGDMVDRMRADHEAHRHRLARRGVRLDRSPADRSARPDRRRSRARERSIRRRRPTLVKPVFGSITIVDRGGDIGPAVGAVLQMHRQPGQVGVGAGQHHRLAGRLGARHLEHLRLVAQPPLDLLQQLVRLDAERRRDPRAAAHDVADQFRLLGTRGAKQHRLRVALHHLGDAGEIDRLATGLEFSVRRGFR